jgi:SAM-dependent methyltransferase
VRGDGSARSRRPQRVYDAGVARATTVPAAVSCWACGSASTAEARRFAPGRLTECRACGFVFAPQITATEVHDFYDDAYFDRYGGEGYGAVPEQRRYESERRVRWISRFAPSPSRLLEIGSAAGYFLASARDRGYAVLGVEPAEREAQSARERFGVDVRTGFLGEVELPAATFDVACAWHVLEHIPQPLTALAQIRRVLAPGGALALEVPNAQSAIARMRGGKWTLLGLPEHVNQFGIDSLSAVLTRAGFEVLASETLATYAYFRPGFGRRPRQLAGRVAVSLASRTLPTGRHPTRHELLRVAARVS